MSCNDFIDFPKGEPLPSVLPGGGDVDVPDDQMIDDIFAERTTRHADDAIDYEDIDELADDDEDLPEEEFIPVNSGLNGGNGAVSELEEHGLQNEAEDEFDAIFGEDDATPNGHDVFFQNGLDFPGPSDFAGLDTLHGMNNTVGLEDDGLNDLGLGFEDDISGDFQPFPVPYSAPQSLVPQKRKNPDIVAIKTAKLRKLVKDMEARQRARLVRKYFPTFSPNKPFNFHDMASPQPKYYAFKRPAIAFKTHLKSLIPLKVTLDIEPDQKKQFKSRKGVSNEPAQVKGVTYINEKDLDFIDELYSTGDRLLQVKMLPIMEQDSVDHDKFSGFNKDLVLATADWDDHMIISPGDSDDNSERTSIQKSVIQSYELHELSYDDDNIFEGQVSKDVLELNMNDPRLLFVPDSKKGEHLKSKALVPTDTKHLHSRFNISNDKAYEIFENNYNTKVRSQLSNLNIEHSIPALRLQTPYYKIKLSKDEARAFHRPKFHVIQGSLICFSKPRIRKKKKDRGKTPQEVFARTNDLTVADTAPLIAMEYSEETPKILSNFGMGSKMINYYRKEKEDDNTRPKAPFGETHVLGVEDRSPFWNYGYVARGDFVPTLYNNMVRAPIFKQEAKSTDFLLVRSQGCGNHQRYFLRRIDHLFAVGNILPAVEVPAPHSRKVTNTSKNRLKMIVFRTMNQNGTARLSVKDISSHFPDQNDMQNRQRLKEFMEYQRQGDDQGFWKIRGGDAVPTEEEIKAMVTPEDVALLDCMQHGQQVLDDIDSLYNDDARKLDFKKEKDEAEASENKELEKKKRDKDTDIDETIDEGLAPWSSSRSFIIANQTKTMLQLNGEGDPTGIGLGFSFLRATQKHGFKPLVPPPKDSIPKNTTASYQQKLYETEVSRIWYGQRSSLTVDNTEGHSLDDIYRQYKPMDHDKYIKNRIAKERDEIIKNEGQKAANQNVLRITRLVRDENDIVQRKVEYIHDPRLIKAYIKRKKQIEGDKMSTADVNEIIPTNDAEMNKIRRKALEEKIANLQKRAKLSKGRKPNKDPLHLAAAAGGTIIDANTVMLPDGSIAFGGKGIGKGKSTTRRCKSCGAFGHIRTNKACPLYHATKGGTIQISQEQKDILLSAARDRPEGSEAPPSGNATPAVNYSAAGSPAGSI